MLELRSAPCGAGRRIDIRRSVSVCSPYILYWPRSSSPRFSSQRLNSSLLAWGVWGTSGTKREPQAPLTHELQLLANDPMQGFLKRLVELPDVLPQRVVP